MKNLEGKTREILLCGITKILSASWQTLYINDSDERKVG